MKASDSECNKAQELLKEFLEGMPEVVVLPTVQGVENDHAYILESFGNFLDQVVEENEGEIQVSFEEEQLDIVESVLSQAIEEEKENEEVDIDRLQAISKALSAVQEALKEVRLAMKELGD